MRKLVIIGCAAVAVFTASANPAVNAITQWNAEQNADPNSRRNQRLRDVGNFAAKLQQMNMQNNGGGMGMGCGMGFQAQDPMAEMGQQLGIELMELIQWFDNFGEAALIGNRLEYQARLVRLVQIRQLVANFAGNTPQGAQFLNVLGVIINVIQERFNQTAPQRNRQSDGVPRFC